MTKKNIVCLVTCAIFITLILLTMYATSPITREIPASSFSRIFDESLIIATNKSIHLPNEPYYISGFVNDLIYLGNINQPFTITIVNTKTNELTERTIKLLETDTITNPRKFRTQILPPSFYTFNGIMPQIFLGDTNNWVAAPLFPNKKNFFVDAKPITKSSVVLRSMSTASQMFQLAKQTKDKSNHFFFNQNALQKQVDGLVDVDGSLLYSKSEHKIIYIYTYRNEYIVMDTNLIVQFRANTIDTNRVAKLKLAKIESKGETIVASPPTNINGKCDILNSNLFVQSHLRAKNEPIGKYQQSSVVDKYDIKSGSYVNSFYIPNHENQRIQDFRITQSSIISLYKERLVIYTKDERMISNKNTKTPSDSTTKKR